MGKYCAEKGFFVSLRLFGNGTACAAALMNLNETLAYAFHFIRTLREAGALESDLLGLFSDVDVNSTKLSNTVASGAARL